MTPTRSGTPLELVLPMPPNIANGSHGHWSGKYRSKQAYWNSLDLIATRSYRNIMGHWIPRPPREPFARAQITSVMYLGGAMDDDNAMRRHKWALDWLKTRGYIKDDRKKCLTWTGFPEQVVKRDGNYRIHITLRPTSAAA